MNDGDRPAGDRERLERLFREALELPREERTAFVARACAGDESLRAELESLLEADETADTGFLSSLDPERAAALLRGSEEDEPERVGPYRILRRLGSGGMGVVYLAEDPRLHRKVALKLLPPWLLADAAARQRMAEEARAASSLDHPNVETVYDIGESDEGLPYIAMAYYPGETLAGRLRQGPLPLDEAVELAAQIAEGLRAVHSRGVVHRDIKPGNVIVTPGGVAKIVDFGIARAVEATRSHTRAAIGTLTYMSPEQTRGEVGPRSDLWAVGAVLYEMLTGRRAFDGPNDLAVLHRINEEEPPALESLRPDVPRALVRSVERCLRKDPDERFPDAAALLEALAPYRSGGSVRAVEPAPARRRGRMAGRRVLVPAASVVLAVLAGLAWAVWRDAGRSPIPAAAERIAVLPLQPVSPDSALARLGRELVVTLSANLDGAGAIEAVDPLTLLTRIGERETPSPDRGLEIARELGAGSALHGSVLRASSGVRLDLALVDLVGGATLARTSVSGAPDDLVALTDSATLAILRQVWRRGEAPVPSLAAVTTRSVPALRAYLDGERAFARADWVEAVRAFERAFAADSTFWFAYWRSLYPRVYEGSRPDSAALAGVLEHRDRFPPADRMLLEAGLEGSLGRELAAHRRLVERFPDYWPGWYSYGNLLLHWAPYLGTAAEEAGAAFERTLALQPEFVSARDHRFWVALLDRDVERAGRDFQELRTLAERENTGLTPDRLHYFETLWLLLRSGGEFPPERLDADAEYIAGYAGSMPGIQFGLGLVGYDFFRAQARLSDAVLARGPRPSIAAGQWLGKGVAMAGRGAFDSAAVALERWVRLEDQSDVEETPDAALLAYGFAVTGARLGLLDPETARGARDAAASSRHASTVEGAAELAWLDGALAHARADRPGVVAARERVREGGSEFADLLDGSLAAFEMALAGDSAGAGRALARLELESAEQYRHHGYGPHHPFLNGLNRLSAADWLAAAGDTATALRLLAWHESILWSAQRFLHHANQALSGPALWRRARLEEALGQTDRAVGHYRAFLQRYDLASGPYAAAVEGAIGALRRLSGEATPASASPTSASPTP